MSCPKCDRVFSVKELVKILKGSGVSQKTIKAATDELKNRRVAEEI